MNALGECDTMPEWLTVVVSIAGGVLILWGALIAVLWAQARRAGDTLDWREIARLVPDVVRLIRRLVADADVPRSVRWTLGALLVYLVLPIDLVPDVIPVIGYADDAIIVALALRFAVRRAGLSAVTHHWPGTDAGLASVLRLVGIAEAPGASLGA